MNVRAGLRAASPREPWFQDRPYVTVAVAAVLFAAVLVLRLFVGDSRDAYSMLFVLPVALLATAFGFRVGAAAGVLAVALMLVWVLVDDVTLSAMGWASRIVPMLLLGMLLGDATDTVRRAEERRRSLEAGALLHKEAIEINDSLIQGMAAAKWSLEAGRTESGLRTLNDTIEQGHAMVSSLIRQAGMGGRTEEVSRAD